MKKLLYTMMAVLTAFAFTACDNGNTEFDSVIDNPPVITFGEFGVFFNNADGSIPVSIQDGTETSTVSSIATATYQIFNAPANEGDPVGDEVSNGSLAGTGGNSLSDNVAIGAGDFAVGDYVLRVSTADSNGNSSMEETTFTVFQGFSTIGIIGDATPTGWGSDTDMTAMGDGVYEITIDLQALSAKFRADDAWAVNWGSADFPSGTATQDGANIPIAEAGSYKVTFDTKDGSYNFEKQ